MAKKHLGNIKPILEYEAIIEFTTIMNPSTIFENGLPFVSMKTEVDANSLTNKAIELHKQYGKIPYSAPLYIWELHNTKKQDILYIGQTVLQKIQKRFIFHPKVVKILAKYVNDNKSKIFFRLCSRLDIIYRKEDNHARIAIEHLPFDQARKIVNDIEAWLIYTLQPKNNIQYKKKEKKYWKCFSVKKLKIGNKIVLTNQSI